jgi:hypothetical protein
MSPTVTFIACALLACSIASASAPAAAEDEPGKDKTISRPAIVKLATVTGPGKLVLRVDADCRSATLPWLSWDTEGGDRAKNNLLRAGASLRRRAEKSSVNLTGDGESRRSDEVQFRLTESGMRVDWTIRAAGEGLTMRVSGKDDVKGLELVFPFDPLMAATTLLPARWEVDGSLRLPAVISAPDFGQMLLSSDGSALNGRLMGSRANHTIDFILELPTLHSGESVVLTMSPVRLPVPKGLKDQSLWPKARRGWFNAIQPAAEWGDQGNAFSAPAGILANNVLSDPVSCLMNLWGDQILLTPQFSSDIRPMDYVRRTVDWFLDCRTRKSGEVVAYWDYADMLDTNPGLLVAAWDYVEATGDRDWLANRIERLEFVADYLVLRDIDGDGLIESTHSGNYGTLKEPMRGGSAYDTINAGHKDAYCNALIYRAFKCLADLEKQLGRNPRQSQYAGQADRLKTAYVKTFYNPATGWLGWWVSQDGQLHDLSSPMINSLAICLGLVDPVQGREILQRLWVKMEEAGFRRFDLGVPITLKPIPRGDYLMGVDGCGVPKREDGSDTFGQYLNGGCMVDDAVWFIVALHIVGEAEKGDRILHAMLERQAKGVFPNGGGFQNGVINVYPKGAEFFTWDGETCGYEGHLTYSYSFLQAILLREPEFRNRLFRPIRE